MSRGNVRAVPQIGANYSAAFRHRVERDLLYVLFTAGLLPDGSVETR